MSIGFCGRCRVEAEDDEHVVYPYQGENWNLPKSDGESLEAIPGGFTIRRDALEGPEVRIARVRLPGRRRKVVREKLVTHTPYILARLDDGGVVIDEPCGVDALGHEREGAKLPRVASCLLRTVFMQYQESGELPESAAFVQ